MEEKKTKKVRISTGGLMLIGLLLIVVSVVSLVWFLIQGQTTVTGGWPEVETTQSLVCENDNKTYPFFEYDESIKKNIKINAIFNDDKLSSIALRYILYYDTKTKITDSENINHTAMSQSFAESGLEFDALGSDYSKGSDLLQFGLYANAEKINNISAKYFMLSELDRAGEYTQSMVKRDYQNKGFKCVVND